LRDPEVVAEAVRIITDRAEELRSAVLTHVDRLDNATRQLDLGSVYDQAHEIRGLAGNAGLNATGRIANGLCRYLDAISRAKYPPDHELVTLHLDAIARAAHAEDEATRLGDTVANELAALVDKKLAEINDSERQA
jgi:chemotaxis protein histidine kinase CheA